MAYRQMTEIINAIRKKGRVGKNPYAAIDKDRLIQTLTQLEELWPELKQHDSPTLENTTPSIYKNKRTDHASKIPAFWSIFSSEALYRWANNPQAKKIFQTVPAMPKFITIELVDGLPIILTYESGKLVNAAFINNGLYGKDITVQAMHLNAIPKTIKNTSNTVITARLTTYQSHYQSYNDSRKDKNLPNIKTKAGVAAHILENKDIADLASTKLLLIAYGIKTQSRSFSTVEAELNYLRDTLDFTIPLRETSCCAAEIDITIRSIKQLSKPEAEGCRLLFNQIKAQLYTDQTANHPKYGVNYYFDSQPYDPNKIDLN